MPESATARGGAACAGLGAALLASTTDGQVAGALRREMRDNGLEGHVDLVLDKRLGTCGCAGWFAAFGRRFRVKADSVRVVRNRALRVTRADTRRELATAAYLFDHDAWLLVDHVAGRRRGTLGGDAGLADIAGWIERRCPEEPCREERGTAPVGHPPASPDTPPGMITVRDAAWRFNVAAHNIRYAIERGWLPNSRMDVHPQLVSEEDMAAWIERWEADR